ncbi:hypothetical protein [Ureibacillus sinduriensis]|uniref:Uncharacterized protein n=1 Tax=Ureibacillus sinduriensis BLB-1 = JCM 15800 TaxID=1384057 RepID=A0A0A3IRH0_9BACL|nr:hypothetical protein [Ureibacillus sinduriensis]KGR77432.1 hypothetical protein CD33_02735 [Ureibacillus sinduriensis BLB-1 = JCM 15800]
MHMIDDLLDLYNLLIKRERTMNDALQIVSSVKGNQFLEELIIRTEKLIVKSLGGSDVHWIEINQFSDAFFQYRQGFINKEQLISIIKKTIG